MKYALIVHDDVAVMVKHVNAALTEGWSLCGGVSATDHVPPGSIDRRIRYCQAIVLVEKPK